MDREINVGGNGVVKYVQHITLERGGGEQEVGDVGAAPATKALFIREGDSDSNLAQEGSTVLSATVGLVERVDNRVGGGRAEVLEDSGIVRTG